MPSGAALPSAATRWINGCGVIGGWRFAWIPWIADAGRRPSLWGRDPGNRHQTDALPRFFRVDHQPALLRYGDACVALTAVLVFFARLHAKSPLESRPSAFVFCAARGVDDVVERDACRRVWARVGFAIENRAVTADLRRIAEPIPALRTVE